MKKKEVKGLRIGDKVVIASFNVNDIPDDGFKGIIKEHLVKNVKNSTVVTFQDIDDKSRTIDFDFKDDTINCWYLNIANDTHNYIGIFTNIQMMFSQYRDIVEQIKKNTKKE